MNIGKTSEIGKDFNSDQLNDALRALWDLMEFYIWHPHLDTAKGIKEQNLQGNRISALIHERFLTKEVRSAIKTQLDYWQDRKISAPYEWTDNSIKWTYKDVPIELKIMHRRYNFFNNPDSVNYNFDDYKLANPFSKYWKARFIVR